MESNLLMFNPHTIHTQSKEDIFPGKIKTSKIPSRPIRHHQPQYDQILTKVQYQIHLNFFHYAQGHKTVL